MKDRSASSPAARSPGETRASGAPLFAFLLMLSVLPSALAAEPGGSFAERARIVALGMSVRAAEAPREALAVLPIWLEGVPRCSAVWGSRAIKPPAGPRGGWWAYAHSGPAPPHS